jgi:single-stranded DNA-specific DHH superfamily exonuclease
VKHLHLKPAAHFLKNVNGKVSILFHKDGDGACSAAQIIAFLASKKIKPELFCAQYEQEEVLPFVESNADHYIIVDMSTDEIGKWLTTLEGKSVLIIDHHTGKDLSNLGWVHINPRFINPDAYVSASEVVGEVLELTEFDGKEYRLKWVARLGGVTDRSLKPNEDEGKASDIIDAVKSTQKDKGLITLAKFLASAKNLDNLLFEEKFQKNFEEMWNEVDRQISEYEIQAVGNINFFEIKGNFSITAILVNKLFELYPKRTIIVYRDTPHGYKISGRSHNYDLNKAFSVASEGIGTGGGHPKASGAKISNFSKFRKHALEEFEKQDAESDKK